MRIGVPREIFPGEKRVATVPDVVSKLVKLGFAVAVERGAGELADLSDEAYVQAGATIAPSAAELWRSSDMVFKVRAPTADEVALMHEGQTLIGFLWPAQNPDLMQQLAAKKVTALSIDALPRTLSRAQKMDALTSMAGVSGYRAVVEAANAFGSLLDMGPAAGAADEAPGLDREEELWLIDHIDADEELDPLEKALLAFIAQETGETGELLRAA